MAPAETAEAILLRRSRFAETSLVLVWLSPSLGKVRTAARGVGRKDSKLRGRLDLFYHAEIHFAHGRKSDLHALREVRLIETWDGLRVDYTRLLAAENVPSKLKAQALLSLGEIEMSRQRPQTAIPYYQRIYVLYGKWRDTVAQAYLRSGEAFEQLDDKEAARKTYEELANSEDLGSLPQAQTAREKLKKFAPQEQAPS